MQADGKSGGRCDLRRRTFADDSLQQHNDSPIHFLLLANPGTLNPSR